MRRKATRPIRRLTLHVWRIMLSDEIAPVRMLSRLVRAALPDLGIAMTGTLGAIVTEIGASCA